MILACLPDAFPGFHRQRLYADKDALGVRRGHPAGARLKNLASFRAARHVAVACGGAREDMIDAWLRRRGIERSIALTVPSYLQALRIAARTDLVAFVPGRLIGALARPLGLVLGCRPRSIPGSTSSSCSIRTRAQLDPGSIWLRNHVLAVGRELEHDNPRPPSRRNRTLDAARCRKPICSPALPSRCRLASRCASRSRRP